MFAKLAPDLSPVSVRNAMHRGVFTCRADGSGLTAARVMAAHHVHGVVVMDEDRRCCRGLVTAADIAAAIHDGAIENSALSIGVRPLVVEPEDSVLWAAELMHEHACSHAIVVDPATRTPVGMLSALDLVELLVADE